MSYICRWLHLSDIHFSTAARAEDFRQVFLYGNPENATHGEISSIESGGLKWQVQQTPVDCIILTGDLFHQGKWTRDERDRISSFIKEIYKICSDASSEDDPWNWTDGFPMDRLFYCPGNHDLKRNAVHEDDGILYLRTEELPDVVNASIHISNGHFTPGDNRTLLTEDTFGPFISAMDRLTNTNSNDEYRYEIQLFHLPSQPPNGFRPVCFIGFNTALLAGQTYDKAELESDIRTAYQEFYEAHNQQNTQQALDAYTKYHTLMCKKQGKLANDEKRQCFPSSEAITKVERALDQMPEHPFMIMFGHHPISFLCESGRIRLTSFARRHNSSIYLCGHNHMPKDEIIKPITLRTHSDYSIHQVYVGGIFSDESGYNQCSFSIGTISQEPTQHNASILYFRYYKDIFDDWVWERKESEEFEPRIPIRTPNNGANGPQQNNGVNRQQTFFEENPPIPEENKSTQHLNIDTDNIEQSRENKFCVGECTEKNRESDTEADGKKPITAKEFFEKIRKEHK